MTNHGHRRNRMRPCNDACVAALIDNIMISAVLMTLFVIVILLVNANFMQRPADTITYSAFTDIGNGVSTRIVDTCTPSHWKMATFPRILNYRTMLLDGVTLLRSAAVRIPHPSALPFQGITLSRILPSPGSSARP